MPSTAQLNVRMDQDLKSEGDAILLEHGVSPSQIVRSLWSTVSKGGDALQRVMDVLDEGTLGNECSSTKMGSDDPALRGTHLFKEGCARLGITGVAYEPDARTWREMREESIASRLAERGML